MNEGLSKEKLELFDSIIRSLSIAFKNSALYPPHHPAYESCVKNLKALLDKWFQQEEKIDVGITQDNLLINAKFVRESSDLYKEVAEYLHHAGIIALSFMKDADTGELAEFLEFIKNTSKTFTQKEDLLKSIPSTPHIKIKEIDYSMLLRSAKDEVSPDEKSLWEFLTRIDEGVKGGGLPESKVEFLMDFLKDTKKSSAILNKIYKDAQIRLDEEKTTKNIRKAAVSILKHFEKSSTAEAKEARKELADIIARLDPNLVVKLFQEEEATAQGFDLSKEIIKDFSDDMLADFITSIISSQESLNENLLRLFDKLVPEEEKAGNVALLATDKLLENLDKDTFSKLRTSIQEALKAEPENKFMSQMYRLTVEAFVSKDVESASFVSKYPALVREFEESLNEENLRKEKIRLLLNIIWLEDDSQEFKKFCEALSGEFKEIITPEYIESVKEIIDLFTEKIRAEQREDERKAKEINNTLEKIITKENIDKIISFIPQADSRDLDDIKYICVKVKVFSGKRLLESLIAEEDPLNRNKFINILTAMDKEVVKDIGDRMDKIGSKDLALFKDLFRALKNIDSQEAHLAAKRLLMNPQSIIRLEALKDFSPQTAEEETFIFEILNREKNNDVQNKIIAILAWSKDKYVIEKLFKKLEKGVLKKHLPDLVKLCGDLKIQDALPYLEKILTKRPFFYTQGADNLRLACVVSLGQLGLTEARGIIEKALNDKSEAVRRMSRIILELDKKESGQIIEE